MRIESTLTFAILTAIAVSAVSLEARAYQPARAPSTNNEAAMRDAKKQDEDLFREFQRQQQELKRTAPTTRDPWSQSPRMKVKPHETEMRIERYVDGTILYSTAIDPKYEALLYKGQKFRKIDSRDEINDRTVFDGRVYRVMRARGAPEQWKDAIGHDSIVTLQTEAGSQLALSVRVKR